MTESEETHHYTPKTYRIIGLHKCYQVLRWSKPEFSLQDGSNLPQRDPESRKESTPQKKAFNGEKEQQYSTR